MGWKDSKTQLIERETISSMQRNNICFIRKDHKCEKIFGGSKSCFIACPSEDDVKVILDLISAKLIKEGIEPIIAINERAYGQDIFCTKICGKILESKFCIVLLDDKLEEVTKTKRIAIPNPNVYYEYGLMTSLAKHIIPLQNKEFKLAFNIQSYDTIKYDPGNLSSELDRAIKDAIKITESKKKLKKATIVNEKSLLRKFEFKGFKIEQEYDELYSIIEDTDFKSLYHYELNCYLYLGKINEEDEISSYLEDLDAVVFRVEEKYRQLKKRKSKLMESQGMTSSGLISQTGERLSYPSVLFAQGENDEDELSDVETNLNLMKSIYFGFIIQCEINLEELEKNIKEIIKDKDRFKITIQKDNNLQIGTLNVNLF